MATVLYTGPDRDMAASYLTAALKTHKQAEIARHLGVDARTVRRWMVEQVSARSLRIRAATSPAAGVAASR